MLEFLTLQSHLYTAKVFFSYDLEVIRSLSLFLLRVAGISLQPLKLWEESLVKTNLISSQKENWPSALA